MRSFKEYRSGIDTIRSFDFRYLGLSALLATSAVFFRSSGLFADGQYGLEDGRGFLVFFLIAACGVNLFVFVRSSKNMRKKPAFSKVSLLVSFLLVVVGLCFAALGSFSIEFHEVFSRCAGVSMGVGSSILILTWGRQYSALSPKMIVLYTACSVGAMALLKNGVLMIPHTLSAYGVLLIFTAFSCVALRSLLYDNIHCDEAVVFRDKQKSRAFSFLWKPLVGAMFCAFVSGLVWDPVAAGILERPLLFEVLIYLLVPLLFAIIILLSKDVFDVTYLIQIVLPIAAAALLIVPFIDFNEIPILDIASQLMNSAGFALFAIIAWAALSFSVRMFGVSSSYVFSAGRLMEAFGMLLGMFVFPVVGQNGQILCLVLVTIYLVCIAVLAMKASLSPHTGHDEQFEDSLRSRCSDLSREYALSPRETEILLFLGRGRSSTHISECLHISVHTVKTHAKRIYEKMGVHSREELLDLVDNHKEWL